MKNRKSVYVVWHTNPSNGDEKLTGVYSTRRKADEFINRLVKQLGFNERPKGFEVCEYDLDKDEWTEGFIPASEAEVE